MRKTVATAGLGMALAVCLCLTVHASGLERLPDGGFLLNGGGKTDGELVLAGGDHHFPPFEYLNAQGEPEGFNVDLLQAVATTAGLRVKLRLGPWDEAREDLEASRLDMLGGMYSTEERRAKVDFSVPTFINSYVIFVRAGSDIKGPADLKDKVLLTHRGDLADDLAKERGLGQRRISCRNWEETLRRLASGEGDCVMAGKAQGLLFARAAGLDNLRVVGPPVAAANYCMALRKGDAALLAKVNEALGALKGSGTYDRIVDKWFAVTGEAPSAAAAQVLKRALLLALLLALLAGAGLAWAWSLRRAVTNKTRDLAGELARRQVLERELKSSEARFRHLVESQRGEYFFYSRGSDGAFLYLSPSVRDILGYEPDKFAALGDGRFTDNPLNHEARRRMLLGLAGRQQEPFVVEMSHSDGGRRLLRVSEAPVLGEDGATLSVEGLARDITELERAERERQSYLRSLELLRGVDETILATDRLEDMTQNVMAKVFELFDCDRAWLLYPCDPEAEAWTIPVELCRPEFSDGVEERVIPANEEGRTWLRKCLASDTPMVVVPEPGTALQQALAPFSVRAMMLMVVRPKLGKPWAIGLHQCSSPRGWTDEERSLFKNIGARMTDALSLFLLHRDLLESGAALLRSEGSYRKLFEQSNDAIVIHGMDGRIMDVNGRACSTLGRGREELLRSKSADFFALAELPRARRAFEALSRDGAIMFESKFRRTDGGPLDVEISSSVVDPDKGVVQMLIRDITARKRAEEELRRTKAYLDSIVNSMPSALVGVDARGQVTNLNVEALKASGLAEANALGKDVEALFPDLPGLAQDVERAIASRSPVAREKVPRIVNGTRHYLNLTVYPLRGGEERGAVLRLDDVTERVRLEALMVQSEKMLSLGGLAAGMAHEINNPLGIITQAIENVSRRLSSELPSNLQAAAAAGIDLTRLRDFLERRQVLGFVDDIKEAGARASAIVKNMLKFGRASEAKFERRDLRPIVRDAVALAANDYDLRRHYDFRHIKIELEFAPDLQDVPCVETELKQVLLNCLKNSAQAMRDNQSVRGRGSVIHVRATQEASAVRLEVEDNGPGLDEHTLKRVFEPFFTTKDIGVGTGLGLSVSYFIITENHKGTMEVESTPGVGCKFIIRLPTADRQAEATG